MTRLQYLGDQAARAERLARTITDTLTIERLLSFAADCRHQIDRLDNAQPAETRAFAVRMESEPGSTFSL
jgi:hypothetical protein